MPHKQAAKARAWGTRFDSLDSSPPSSPSSQNDHTPVTDEKAQTPDSPVKKKEERTPHDASIFVGSLPTNVEHQELTRLLSEHLSQHAEVRSIKVVRDSKGGVCAFVQCEDAAAAARLIHTLQTTPTELFLGRTLRFEPARAFRTLLISFRAPIQSVPSGSDDDLTVFDGRLEFKRVELDLPVAIRLWKPRGAKYVSVLYNDEASQFDVNAASNSVVEPESGPGGAFAGSGTFLYPLKFDKDTIVKIVSAFGKVEQFCTYTLPGDRFDVPRDKYPFPHDAPRASSMDRGCWQVKWGHRDDCVNALMTLRRVPFLTVTWAHQPNSSSNDYQQTISSPTMYYSPRLPSSGLFLAGATYPLHVQLGQCSPRAERQDVQIAHRNEYQRQGDLRGYTSPAMGGGRIRTVTESSNGTILSSPVSRRPILSELFGRDEMKKIDWSDTDLSPLGDTKNSMHGGDRASDSISFNKHVTIGPCDEVLETPPRRSTSLNVDASVPPTPEFVTSPITPGTPGFSVLHTPISQDDDLTHEKDLNTRGEVYGYLEVTKVRGESAGLEERDGAVLVRSRGVDPTTIFVGGLEMFGPNAWDEHRVRSLFERYGGIEDVRVVRPLNKRSAFAFVRFNNTEAPARAVAEEHNRTYDGKQIRVQLRDNNSHGSSNTFKYGQRGRARGYQYGGRPSFGSSDMLGLDLGKGRFDELCRDEVPARMPDGAGSHMHTSLGGKFIDHDKSRTSAMSPAELHFPSIQRSGPDTVTLDTSSETSSVPDARPSMSPPPSSVGSSVSVATPVTPYPMAPIGYYPNPWMHGFGQPWPYPVPYVSGYVGHSATGTQTPHSYPGTPGSSDASGPTAQPPWMGMYRPFIPYTPYPVQHEIAHVPLPGSQPPLRPTGFVQNEHGMLVPVYQPDALGQYMSSGRESNLSMVSTTCNDGQTTVPNWSQANNQPLMFPPPGIVHPTINAQAQGPIPAHAPTGIVPWYPQSNLGWPSSSGQHHHPVSSGPCVDGSSSGAPTGGYSARGQPPGTTRHGIQRAYYQQQGFYAHGHQKRQPRKAVHIGAGRNHSRRSSPDGYAGGASLENSHNAPSMPPEAAASHLRPMGPQATMQVNGEWNQWPHAARQM